jgi:hypothetical protein
LGNATSTRKPSQKSSGGADPAGLFEDWLGKIMNPSCRPMADVHPVSLSDRQTPSLPEKSGPLVLWNSIAIDRA